MDRGNPRAEPRVKNELRKQQYKTVTLSDYNHLAHVIVFWPIKNLYVTVSLLLCYFVFEGNFQVQAPMGLYSEGRFNGGFFCFCVTSLGGLYMEGPIFGILRYLGGLLFFCIIHHRIIDNGAQLWKKLTKNSS